MPSNSEVCLAISHALLAGTAVYCLFESKDAGVPFCPFITFGIFAINGLVNIVAESSYNSSITRLCATTSYAELLFALPVINTQLWLDCGYRKELSAIWCAVSLILFIMYIFQDEVDLQVAYFVVNVNLVVLGAVSIVNGLNYGIAAVAAYIVPHLCVNQLPMKYGWLYNIGLCFFAYFALRALGYGTDAV